MIKNIKARIKILKKNGMIPISPHRFIKIKNSMDKLNQRLLLKGEIWISEHYRK